MHTDIYNYSPDSHCPYLCWHQPKTTFRMTVSVRVTYFYKLLGRKCRSLVSSCPSTGCSFAICNLCVVSVSSLTGYAWPLWTLRSPFGVAPISSLYASLNCWQCAGREMTWKEIKVLNTWPTDQPFPEVSSSSPILCVCV